MARSRHGDRERERDSATAIESANGLEEPSAALTPREAEVALWLANGKTNVEIAIILDANRRTVEKHVENILRKLEAENRTTAALLLRTFTL